MKDSETIATRAVVESLRSGPASAIRPTVSRMAMTNQPTMTKKNTHTIIRQPPAIDLFIASPRQQCD